MPSDPRRPDEPRPDHQGPITRGDLFGPDGPLRGRGQAPDEDATQAYHAEELPERTRAFRPEPGPDQPGPYQPDPYQPGPSQAGPSQAGPSQAGPSQAGPSQAGPPQAGPYQPGYTQGYDQGGPQAYQPGQYQPGQYQPGDPRNPYGGPGGGDPYGAGPPGPNRSALLAALLVIAVGVVAAGVVYIVFGDRGQDGPTATPGTSAAQSSADPGQSAEPTEQPSPSPSETETDPADYESIPAEPWTDKELDFGLLTEVQASDVEVRVVVNRATYLTGEAAKRKNGGEAPDNDYLIEDTNPRLRTFVLRPDAPIKGSTRLAGTQGSDGEDMTVSDFAEAAQEALSKGGSIPVWLRHEGNELDGPVTALAEQYAP